MSKGSAAWLLDCGGGTRVAVALPSLLHLIEDSTLLCRVPVVPQHLGQVLLWQQRVFPVLDLALLMGSKLPARTRTYACMLGWCDAGGHSDYGALLIRELPRRIQITDQALATPTPSMAGQWQGLALTYFGLIGQVIPIIAPAALFEPASHLERAAGNRQAQRPLDTRSA